MGEAREVIDKPPPMVSPVLKKFRRVNVDVGVILVVFQSTCDISIHTARLLGFEIVPLTIRSRMVQLA
jgi:hypothetical protein